MTRIANFLTLCEIWGYGFGIGMGIMMLATLTLAFQSPEKTVTIAIDNFREAKIDMVVPVVGMIITIIGWISFMKRMIRC
ncbi:MAG: hypothetical protein ACXQTL_06480 [Methanosarcinales archaeon]